MSNKSFNLDGIGQHGHDVGTRITPVLDGPEAKATHAKAAQQSSVQDFDARDQADATGDLLKYQTGQSEIRLGDQADLNSATAAAAQKNGLIDEASYPWKGGR